MKYWVKKKNSLYGQGIAEENENVEELTKELKKIVMEEDSPSVMKMKKKEKPNKPIDTRILLKK